MKERGLTTLEYIVLGLVSLAPQSGYSIVTFFEGDSFSWSASPGAIYPILKRLEQVGFIAGEIEMTHETRPRKMYSLSQEGAMALDDWLREVPKMRPFYEQREIALLRFQFMEKRLPYEEVVRWLDAYIDAVRYASNVENVYTKPIEKAMAEDQSLFSIHSQLLMEAYIMEINTLRTWLELVKARLQLNRSRP